MINLDRVATEIQSVGLYDLVFQDVQKVAGKTKVTIEEIKKIISEHSEIMNDYLQTNVEYNVTNIHLRDIDVEKVDEEYKEKAQVINENIARLKELEKYTLDFEQSATLVIIFSIEFFVLFSVQYFIVLLDLKEWQWWIYGLFASSVLFAWAYARKEGKVYDVNKILYEELYVTTQELIEELEEIKAINKESLWIHECEEHV